jgi:ABC-2 type transport system ATP-binding protein
MIAIEIENVSKTFGTVEAVANLSAIIPEASIYGFIGPNGSGKSTTMRMTAGIFNPDRGSIRVFGGEVSQRRRGLIGYLPEERGIYKKMKVRALLEFHAELRGGKSAVARIDAWLEKLDLTHCASRPVETLSKGMTQKVQFIAAVVPEPKLVILDEPFSGLDPISAESIRAAILELRRNGVTVILSTHDMAVAESMCDRILMMFRGKKVLDGSLAEIQERYGNDTIRITGPNTATALAGLPGVEHVRDFGQIQELRMARGCDPQELLRAAVALTSVTAFSIAKPSLQDIFIRIAGPVSTAGGNVETQGA